MRETKVATRYAKSILQLAIERQQVDAVNQEMIFVAKTCAENRELVLLLESPIVKTDKKQAVLRAIFAGQLSELTIGFIDLLAGKKREYLLPEIAEMFTELYSAYKGVVRADVTSAVALDESVKAQIKQKMNVAGEIEFVEHIDADLIGGFVVRIGDKQYDGSVATALRELKKNFTNKDYITSLN